VLYYTQQKDLQAVKAALPQPEKRQSQGGPRVPSVTGRKEQQSLTLRTAQETSQPPLGTSQHQCQGKSALGRTGFSSPSLCQLLPAGRGGWKCVRVCVQVCACVHMCVNVYMSASVQAQGETQNIKFLPNYMAQF
jgi:hypothetical protein